MNGFTAIAEPTRRTILDQLRLGASDVQSLVRLLDLPQPLVSKHLKVLREAGAVEVEIAGKRRVYRLSAEPLPDVLAWVRPYVELWSTSLDRLEAALDHALDPDREEP
jgi:DNA-binding transcriptional ArsR family regulator